MRGRLEFNNQELESSCTECARPRARQARNLEYQRHGAELTRACCKSRGVGPSTGAVRLGSGWLLVVFVLLVSSWVDIALSTSVQVRPPPECEVRYMYDNSLYAEALVNGRWTARYWSAGRPVERNSFADSSAFALDIKQAPDSSGISLNDNWQWVSAKELPKANRGPIHFVVELARTFPALELRVHTLLDGTPILTRWLEILNRSAHPIALTACYPWSGRLWAEEAPITLGHSLAWQISMEGWFGWTPLKAGKNVFRQDRGLYADDPYFVLRNDANGEYFFGQLAWPANYSLEFIRQDGLFFRAGPIATNALRVVLPNETVSTPLIHLGCVTNGFDAAVQAMHQHIRRSVLPKRDPQRSYLVEYLIPEDQPLTVYRGDAFNEANLTKCIDVAAAAGCEVFIVDGPTWAEGTTPSTFSPGCYGNWVPRHKWFPYGFDPLIQHCHRKGLLFGVYAEPEGGRGDWTHTQAYQQHPEWFVTRRPMFPGSNFINMAFPEAAAYVESQMDGLFSRLHIDLHRHDQNGVEGGDGSSSSRYGFVENDYWRHYEALYSIVNRLHLRHHQAILQQASAGGCRLDLATISRWQEHFTSDNASYPHLYQAAAGLSVFLPPEILVSANGMAGGRTHPDFVTMLRSVYFFGQTPMFFNAMLPGSVDKLTASDRELLTHYNTIYKKFVRPLLADCRVFHHAPVNADSGVESGNWLALEFASADQRRAWATIVRLGGSDQDVFLFKPKGLNASRSYTVTFDNANQKRTATGARLGEAGLSVGPLISPRSELLVFQAI